MAGGRTKNLKIPAPSVVVVRETPVSTFVTVTFAFGITAFEVNTGGISGEEPDGNVKDVRVDVPPGLATNAQAVPQCSDAEFKTGLPCRPDSKVGVTEITAFVGLKKMMLPPITVYNLTPPEGSPAAFGFNLEVALLKLKVQLKIIGGVPFGAGAA